MNLNKLQPKISNWFAFAVLLSLIVFSSFIKTADLTPQLANDQLLSNQTDTSILFSSDSDVELENSEEKPNTTPIIESKRINNKLMTAKNVNSSSIKENEPNAINVIKCDEKQFQCMVNNVMLCLDLSLKCDEIKDCDNGEDEKNCDIQNDSSGCDLHTQFTCEKDQKCINIEFQCDGFEHCKDGSDEFDCPQFEGKCSAKEWQCADGTCIHERKRCDITRDCVDGSDEYGCNYTCSNEEFQCKKDSTCIPIHLKCNGQVECSDGSDEHNCTLAEPRCESHKFDCGTYPPKCIDMESVCNGQIDCKNEADEPDECEKDPCVNNPCKHQCKPMKLGFQCACDAGYKLANDSINCIDIDECKEIPGFCSGHKCKNLEGSAKCECELGFRLSFDKDRCKLIKSKNAKILFTKGSELRSVPTNGINYLKDVTVDHLTELIQSELNLVTVFAFNLNENYIVWHDQRFKQIMIGQLIQSNNSLQPDLIKFAIKSDDAYLNLKARIHGKKPQVLLKNISSVDGIAIDYVHNLIYWTNSNDNLIEVANISNAKTRTKLIYEEIDSPKGIAINVQESMLVWTECGNSPKISSSKQDGSLRRTLYKEEHRSACPNSVAIDIVIKQIYWADNKLHTLNSIDFNGANHHVIYSSAMYLYNPLSLDVFEDKLYWTEPDLESILSIDKFGTPNKVNKVLHELKAVSNLGIQHVSKQPFINNLCTEANCGFLCLPRTDLNSFTCICSEGQTANFNKTGCFSNDKQSTDLNNIVQNLSKELLSEQDVGSRVFFLSFILILSTLIFLIAALYVVSNLYRRNLRKFDFDNTVYQKANQDNFPKCPSSLEPLTSQGTNDFV